MSNSQIGIMWPVGGHGTGFISVEVARATAMGAHLGTKPVSFIIDHGSPPLTIWALKEEAAVKLLADLAGVLGWRLLPPEDGNGKGG